MRVLSTGDWHFGAGYDLDLLASIEQMCGVAKKDPPDLIAITGDIFEAESEPDSRNKADDCMLSLAEIAPVRIIKGNHDVPGDLLGFANLKSAYPILVYEYYSYEKFGDVVIHYLPWVTRTAFMALHPTLDTKKADETISQIMLKYLTNEVLITGGSKVKHILVSHMLIAGAKAQNHQKLQGDGVCLGISDIPDAGFDAAMIGHIHLRQQFPNPDSPYFYNGSIAALNYGESPEKYYSILNTDDMSVEWIKLDTIDRYVIKGTWNPTLDCNGLEFDQNRIRGARVRVELRINEGEDYSFAKHAVQDMIEKLGALEIKIDHQSIPKEQIRAINISKAKASADKLMEWWSATMFPEQEIQDDMINKLSEIEEEVR